MFSFEKRVRKCQSCQKNKCITWNGMHSVKSLYNQSGTLKPRAKQGPPPTPSKLKGFYLFILRCLAVILMLWLHTFKNHWLGRSIEGKEFCFLTIICCMFVVGLELPSTDTRNGQATIVSRRRWAMIDLFLLLQLYLQCKKTRSILWRRWYPVGHLDMVRVSYLKL